PSLLGVLGMTLIGAGSLGMAYRTTLGLYQGRASTGKRRRAPVARAPADRTPRGQLMEARLFRLSEPVSAVALAGFRSLLRAPEVKLALLGPVIMGFVFGSVLWQARHSVPESARPWLVIGGLAFMLMT